MEEKVHAFHYVFSETHQLLAAHGPLHCSSSVSISLLILNGGDYSAVAQSHSLLPSYTEVSEREN